jgi:hypothetical protein
MLELGVSNNKRLIRHVVKFHYRAGLVVLMLTLNIRPP